jgi:EAL domain-containing protein (putative c-di-GMP-specific phosphodiesterase class I)
LLFPDSFVPAAEQTELVEHLTRWVLHSALTTLPTLDPKGELAVAVNISARSLVRPEFAGDVLYIVAASGVDPRRVILELTETALMTDTARATRTLARLSAAGLRISIDDFGAGQTSLGYLATLPISELKIDKAFVLRLAQSADDQTIARSVIELGHNLDYRVTAEGVEDEAGLRLLEAYGCDYAQGYFIARALPADAFFEMAAQSQRQHRFAGALP